MTWKVKSGISKMATGGHFQKKNESCVLIRNGEKCKRKWISDIQNGHRRPFSEKKWKLCFNPKWREMQMKMNFGHLKWSPAAILKKKVVFWSEMARNTNENEFRTSKMPTDNRLREKLNKCILIWNIEVQTKMAGGNHFEKMKLSIWFEMVRNVRKNRWASGPLVLLLSEAHRFLGVAAIF